MLALFLANIYLLLIILVLHIIYDCIIITLINKTFIIHFFLVCKFRYFDHCLIRMLNAKICLISAWAKKCYLTDFCPVLFILWNWTLNRWLVELFEVWIVHVLYWLGVNQILLRVELIYWSLFFKELIYSLHNPLGRCNAFVWSLIYFDLFLAALEIKWSLNALLIDVI